jgi:hypothetical protein
MFTSAHSTSQRGIHDLQHLVDLALDAGARSLLLLSAVGNGTDHALATLTETLPVPVFGGVFPKLIFGGATRAQGYVVVGCTHAADVRLVRGLSDLDFEPAAAVASVLDALPPEPGTVFVFLHGRTHRVDSVLEALYDRLGPDHAYVGAGAGSLDAPSHLSVVSGHGAETDALLVAFLPRPASLVVEHGFATLAGPFTATSAAGTVLSDIDFEPALGVYARSLDLSEHEALRIAYRHPLGIALPDGTLVVRDIVAAAGTALISVGEIPPHSRLYVLHGTAADLIRSAREAARCLASADGPVLAFDCVSRSAVLGDDADLEYVAVADGLAGIEVVGAHSVGEIASRGGQPIEFHNKTLVLVAGARAATTA